MTTTEKRTIQKPELGRKRRVVEESDLSWEMSYLRKRNRALANDNRLLRTLVAQLSLEKLQAEEGL